MQKKILVISSIPSHPQYAGHSKRIYTLLKFLQSNNIKINFLYYDRNGKNKSNCEGMVKEWDHFTLFVDPLITRLKRKIFKFSNRLFKFDNALNNELDIFCDRSLLRFIKAKVQRNFYNAVLIEYIYLSKVFDLFDNRTLKILDTIDVFTNRNNILQAAGLKRATYSLSAANEAIGLKRADVVIAIQKLELEYFKKFIGPKYIEVGHMIENKFIKKTYTTLMSIGIIAGNDIVNRSSVKSFLDLIKLNDKLREMKVYIAGPVCQSIKNVDSNVILLGKVASLDNFFTIADAYITPTVSGTGLKIKTIETLSYGVPLFSTADGSIGIESVLQEHNYKNLYELISGLENYFVNNIDLSTLQNESVTVFNKYRDRTEKQLNDLVNFINS